MRPDIIVRNIMADGTICEDLSTYIGPDHPLPETAKRLILEFIRDGQRILEEQSGG